MEHTPFAQIHKNRPTAVKNMVRTVFKQTNAKGILIRAT